MIAKILIKERAKANHEQTGCILNWRIVDFPSSRHASAIPSYAGPRQKITKTERSQVQIVENRTATRKKSAGVVNLVSLIPSRTPKGAFINTLMKRTSSKHPSS